MGGYEAHVDIVTIATTLCIISFALLIGNKDISDSSHCTHADC